MSVQFETSVILPNGEKLTRYVDQPIAQLLGPPMSGKSSTLEAMRLCLGASEVSAKNAHDRKLDQYKILGPLADLTPMIGPRCPANGIDFTGPIKAARTVWTYAPILSRPQRDQLARDAWTPLKSGLKATLEAKSELLRTIDTLGGAIGANPLVDANRALIAGEVTALACEIANHERRAKEAKKTVESEWPEISRWFAVPSLHRDQLLSEIDLTSTGQLTVKLPDQSVRKYTEGSTGLQTVVEIGLFMRLADVTERPAILFLDDDELKGLTGHYLENLIDKLARWALDRPHHTEVWMARQTVVCTSTQSPVVALHWLGM